MSEGRAEEEFLRRIQKAREYWERASFYLKNYENDRIKSEDKASEDLWGVVSCLMNAISVVELGKSQPRHGNQREFAMQFLISEFEDGKELFKIYEKAEKLHSNFYHSFICYLTYLSRINLRYLINLLGFVNCFKSCGKFFEIILKFVSPKEF